MIPVHVIGLGMSPEDLTPRSLEIIRTAQVLVGGKRHLEYFRDHPAEKIPLASDIDGVSDRIRKMATSKQLVVLSSGDPNFYGVGPRLVAALGEENVVIHPNITTVQAAFSRLKMSWHDVQVVSLHGRDWGGLNEALNKGAKLAVYTDPAHSPAHIAHHLIEYGWEDARFCVLEDLGRPAERITWLHPQEAEGRAFSDLNLVVITKERPSPSHISLHLGMPEEAYLHQSGLITKAEVRAVVLAKLALSPRQILWDIGAGCGSVGLEASLLIPGGKIYAIEQDPQRTSEIKANRARLGVRNLEVVCGLAPGCLEALPAPDRVFLGGGSSNMKEILQKVFQCIPSHGRVVLTATLLETVHRARSVFDTAGWDTDITQLQVNRSRRLGVGTYLAAMNPVWVIAAPC